MKPTTRKILVARRRVQAYRARQFPVDYIARLRHADSVRYWRLREQGGPSYAKAEL